MLISCFYLFLLCVFAREIKKRVALFDRFHGLPGYLTALGFTLFCATWVDFITYVLCGWGTLDNSLSIAVALGATLYCGRRHFQAPSLPQAWKRARTGLASFREWNYPFLFLAVLVLSRFYNGLEEIDGNIWCNFNFVDTAYHLSMVHAFTAAHHFPPVDLDMAPYPLKYHFLADFFVAQLHQYGMPFIPGMWLMNLISAACLVGAIWSVLESWLKLSPRWILLGGTLFLFLNTGLANIIHYLLFRPEFFQASAPLDGMVLFPFYNFESMLSNLLEPQRGFLFALPIALLIMHALFGDAPLRGQETAEEHRVRRQRSLLWAFMLVCLLPLAHIIAFVVLACAATPVLWPERRWLISRWRYWALPFAVGLLQIFYLQFYGPPVNRGYIGSLTETLLPPNELAGYSTWLRRPVFWLLTDGDFLLWGGLYIALAAWQRGAVWRLLVQWRWYFLSCLLFFSLVNFFSFMYCWGDCNKFVLFLNLGLTLAIVYGAAEWTGRRGAWRANLVWVFLFSLSIVPHVYEYYRDIYTCPDGKILLFQRNSREAAKWLRSDTSPTDVVLTAAYNTIHFVTPLAGRPVMAGLYGNTDMYRQDEREEEIRNVYEKGAFEMVRKLGARYICISRNERRRYTINPKWLALMQQPKAIAFRAGEADEFDSVYIFDAKSLPSP
jgi:hypothetical protein